MVVYLKLPKKDPKRLAYMFNKLTGRNVCDRVEFNNSLTKLLSIVPIFERIGSTTVGKQYGNTTVSETTYKEILKGVDIIVNPDIYKEELKQPNPNVRQEAAEEFLGAASALENMTLKELLILLGITGGGVAILASLANEDDTQEIMIVVLVALILAVALYATHIEKSKYKRVLDRALKYDFVTGNPYGYGSLTLEEGVLNTQGRKIVSYIFKLAKNGNKTGLKKVALNLLSKAAPKNTFAYKHNAKVIQSL